MRFRELADSFADCCGAVGRAGDGVDFEIGGFLQRFSVPAPEESGFDDSAHERTGLFVFSEQNSGDFAVRSDCDGDFHGSGVAHDAFIVSGCFQVKCSELFRVLSHDPEGVRSLLLQSLIRRETGFQLFIETGEFLLPSGVQNSGCSCRGHERGKQHGGKFSVHLSSPVR